MINTRKLLENISVSFENKVKSKLSDRLKSFYVVGSYAFGKISSQRPDINFLLIFNGFTSPQDYLLVGEICKDVEDEFSKKATIKIEFRPFRYIKPRYINDIEVSINPILTSTSEIQAGGNVIFNKWFTNGLKSANKLLLGEDFLKTLDSGTITKEDLRKGAMFDLAFFTIPLSRAPTQYNSRESNLLLNESFVNAKDIAYLGLEVAMSQSELDQKKYIEYIQNKEEITKFYKERYNKDVSKIVKKIFWIRDNYLQLKDDPIIAQETFVNALNLANVIRKKVFQ